ncbi:Glu/Leu/Phe/Val dehydrogenase dimerization domain-containing protein [Streptomyces sp. NPDC052301]|uniref:Glu/Leu/Phe/Val dehydrogenase dimerization domain-containing protein n=1 Tax=Streptomyces sp. NPDC052301 TaxID=3365687 RepID=UPI0037CCCA0C
MVRIIEYRDPVEGCPGFLVYDGTDCRLAAGGCRMKADLTADTLRTLSARMTLKQRVLGLNVDGAKCGIAYDPRGPRRAAVLRRFLDFLRQELRTRFSMGADMNTRFEELDAMAAELGIGSVKYAVRVAQHLSEHEFRARMALLDAPVGRLTVGRRRAGHALGHAALAAAAHAGYRPDRLSCALQGFGNLGRAAALALLERGVRITAVADEFGCVVDPRGLDIAHMLCLDQRRPIPSLLGDALRLPPEALFDLPADVLILAGPDNALTAEQAALLPVPVVAVGANCGLGPNAERLLADRGVLVVPDFIGGIGGSASMEALFGPQLTPEPRQVLDTVAGMLHELVDDILVGAHDQGLMPRQIAESIARSAVVSPGERPYGSSPYGTTTRPRGTRMAAITEARTKRGNR